MEIAKGHCPHGEFNKKSRTGWECSKAVRK